MRSIRLPGMRPALGTLLAIASLNAQAIYVPDSYLCGTGTITEVLEGAYGGEGLHLAVDWEGGAPGAQAVLPTDRQGTVRILSADVSDERMKALRSLSLLAFASDFRVVLATGAKTDGGGVDCGKVREIHITK